MSRRLPKVVSAWLCVVTQGMAAMAMTTVVLCFGEGGHAAVEPASAEDCCATRRTIPEGEVLSDTVESCRCTDLPILEPAVRTVPAGSEIAVPVLLPAACSALQTPLRRPFPLASSLSWAGTAPASLRALRSVVLLA